ncbi:hypothetical protein BRADI_5g15897v3 [Brachypodium distachyon]|uniref:Uncharacterized protein n=1 Tax=Brachypodium distachyon TaxID=15368 RepID=A0A0Q3EB87_BRADI|nr:hypothetical protein BRADI_5g15897v3 [Brachypodium distachyon]
MSFGSRVPRKAEIGQYPNGPGIVAGDPSVLPATTAGDYPSHRNLAGAPLLSSASPRFLVPRSATPPLYCSGKVGGHGGAGPTIRRSGRHLDLASAVLHHAFPEAGFPPTPPTLWPGSPATIALPPPYGPARRGPLQPWWSFPNNGDRTATITCAWCCRRRLLLGLNLGVLSSLSFTLISMDLVQLVLNSRQENL